MDNSHYDVTEASGRASNINATIVACRNERVKLPMTNFVFLQTAHSVAKSPFRIALLLSNSYVSLLGGIGWPVE